MDIDVRRVKALNDYSSGNGDTVVYWMSREQRVDDNWALLYAQELAEKNDKRLAVVFCLVPHFLQATIRHYGFMFRGLEKVEEKLKLKNISFEVLLGDPADNIIAYCDKKNVSALVTDFDPLKIKRKWKSVVQKKINVSFYEIDAHNIVPIWEASDKLEFAAYTIRPKINKKLDEFLTGFPELKKQKSKIEIIKNDWKKIWSSLKVNIAVKEVDWLLPGEDEAEKILKKFIDDKIWSYSDNRNNPNYDATSNLSPYLHFGQISAQRIAYEVKASKIPAAEFLEELIIRRELTDNYCYYNLNYDSLEGCPEWAKKTLKDHEKDPRDYVYSLKQFENAETHDDLWNAAQLEMMKKGKMHGYMRMYWAKKILEWTKNASDAFNIAIYLNDKYELDGRDPNGYVGVAWSIGGVHDRAWFERPIFGKIRYMNYNGCKNKFDVERYIKNVSLIN
ncbi:MAG: deoxyribodipyrimidine photo-lyase [Candidatus Woesearchaeota archaeon]